MVPFDDGRALFDLERPLVWDANYVRVERGDGGGAAALADVAERLQGEAGLAHRMLVVLDERAGPALGSGLAALGWRTEPWLVMVCSTRPPGSPSGLAREVTVEEVRAARRDSIASEPWASASAADQLISRDDLIRATVTERCFAARADGRVVSRCQLFADEGVAQIENVATLASYRNRGLARAVVATAANAALDAGCELLFLTADAGDWPQQIYRGLGFEPVGLLHRFRRQAAPRR